VQAIQLAAHGQPGKLELRTVADPRPGPGEVVVRVEACGLNHLDLWLEEGGLPVEVALPRTPGCEISGLIDECGPGVTDWRAGRRVAVQSNLFCGRCEFCAQGEDSLCLKSELLGVQRDGGFAEKVVVPARALVPLPDEVSFEAAAALTLAGSTAMHMLTNRTQVQLARWVLVIGGASGVGSAAIQIARASGARVLSTGSTTAKRELCLRLGAEAAVDPARSDWPAEVRRLTGKHGADIVVEHVGGAVLEQAFACLARNGTVVTCGATAGRQVSLNLWPFFVKQHRLVGSYGRNRADITATLDWAAHGRLRPVIDRVLPLAETPRAFEALRSRAVLGKIVIRPAGERHNA
jgi:NADPH:quinone reductase-like Zn-dependent oxidoreductase